MVNREGANLLDGPILYRTRLGSMAVAASMRCLVLNASMEPISVVSAQRGLVLLLKERAMLLERAQAKTTAAKEAAQRIVFKSERQDWDVPSVIVLRQYVNVLEGGRRSSTSVHGTNSKRKPGTLRHKGLPSISTKNVLRRDGGLCAYCGGKAASIDHVVPVSRGGQHVWENVVAACMPCNHKKGNKLVSECGKEFRHATGKKLGPPNLMAQRLGSLWMKGGHSNPHWAAFFKGCPDIFLFSEFFKTAHQAQMLKE